MNLKDSYYKMLRIRMVEEEIAFRYHEEGRAMKTPIHLSDGQEAIAVGVCNNLRVEDEVFSNHRPHAHYLAKGGSLKGFIAELHNKSTGCCRGKGGSMHLIDTVNGFALSSGIVAGNVSISTGYALSQKMQGKDGVTVCFFGDGASEEGSVYESICFSSIHQLPVVFCCENNGYAISTPFMIREPLMDVSSKFSSIIQTYKIDGNDIEAVESISRKCIDNARVDKKPSLIEFITYRQRDHSNTGDGVDGIYRTTDEVNHWKTNNDPIKRLEDILLSKGILTLSTISGFKEQVRMEILEAFEFAKKSELPSVGDLWEGVYDGL